MVINFIQNELLRPEGSTQLFHQWERIASISKEKYNFTQVVTLLSTQNKNAETQKNSITFDNLVANELNNISCNPSLRFTAAA